MRANTAGFTLIVGSGSARPAILGLDSAPMSFRLFVGRRKCARRAAADVLGACLRTLAATAALSAATDADHAHCSA